MYVINRRAVFCLKFCFFIGMPLLSSFMLQPLAPYRLLALVLLGTAYTIDICYPEKVAVRPDALEVKLYLQKDWLEIPVDELRIEKRRRYLMIYCQDVPKYRISTERLSLRLYEQLRPYLAESPQ